MADNETNETTETTTSTPRSVAGIWEIQHYFQFQEGSGWGTPIRVTEDPKFDTSNDDQTYEASYLDRKVQPTYTMSRKTSLEFEIDAILPGDIQARLAAHEDDLNVPVLYIRTLAVDMATGAALPETALAAKRAEGNLTMQPISGEASGVAKLKGTVNLTSGYTYGTFNTTTGEFTANA